MKANKMLCDFCGINLDNKDYKKHYLIHMKAKFECPKCDKILVTKGTLKQHMEDVHNNNVKCDCCDKIFSKKANLTAHLRNLEGKAVKPDIPKEPQTCIHCGRTAVVQLCT